MAGVAAATDTAIAAAMGLVEPTAAAIAVDTRVAVMQVRDAAEMPVEHVVMRVRLAAVMPAERAAMQLREAVRRPEADSAAAVVPVAASAAATVAVAAMVAADTDN
jgi:hypothetical protein